MIHLTKGQQLHENPGMVVYGSTGYYNDGDVVVCAMSYAPEEPACGYEAKYIAYGTMVYGISDEDKLMEEVTKIDPENLYGMNTEQTAIDKMVSEIVPEQTDIIESETEANQIDPIETVEIKTETYENGEIKTTTTTTTSTPEEVTPDVTESIINTPETSVDTDIPVIPPDISVNVDVPVEDPVIIPDVPIIETPAVDLEFIAPSVIDQTVSRSKSKKIRV